MSHPFSETSYQKTLCNSGSDCHGMTLTERAGGVFHASFKIHFRVSRGYTSPLTEVFQVFHAIRADQAQHRIQHRRHMSRVKEETVPVCPCHIIRIEVQELRIQHVNVISATHCTSWMT